MATKATVQKKKRSRPTNFDSSSCNGSNTHGLLRYKGSSLFRARLICSLLSGRSLLITDIRLTGGGTRRADGHSSSADGTAGSAGGGDDVQVGLLDFEASFLRLLDDLTNGTKVEINETGTMLRFRPGVITGGRVVHDCGVKKSIGWFVEGILPLAPFSKRPFDLELSGVTNDDVDISADTLKAVTFPLLQHFGIGEEGGLLFKVKRRGAPPEGGGLVELRCPVVRQLKPLNLQDPGLIKRVRGNAYCTKVSPQVANRVAESAKGLLNRLLPDVWVHTDHYKGAVGGNSPGFGVTLVAESTTGIIMSAETAAVKRSLPEDIGKKGSVMLLEEIRRGGCVDSVHQPLMFLFMALGPEDVGRLRIGALTPYSVAFLRLLRDVFGTVFKLKRDEGERGDGQDGTTITILASCLGVGHQNMSRKAT